MSDNRTGGGGALINLGNLSKPATVLIEKISDAVGGIAKPWQMVRTARAEVKADTIRAQGRIEISEIERRALTRMIREETIKQENIENITAKAILKLSSDAKPENIENDWLSHFFDRCRLVTDEEMQSLWANILAEQANKPGSFSKRTIELAATLDKSDAEMFTNLCTYVWIIGDAPVAIINNIDAEIFGRKELNFGNLTHLDNIGLITFKNVTDGFTMTILSKSILVRYMETPINVEFLNESNNVLLVGMVLLTRAGRELAAICRAGKSEEYFMTILDNWIQSGHVLTSPIS